MPRTEIAAEDFGYADGNLETVSANWRCTDRNFGNANVVSGKVDGGNRSIGGERWVGAGTFTDDQYVTAIIEGFGFSNDYAAVLMRVSTDYDDGATSTRDHYGIRVRDDAGGSPANRLTEIIKVVNGTLTVISSARHSWANGDQLEGEVEGTTIRAMKGGTVLFSATDTDLTTGNPGLMCQGGTVTLDTWRAGNITAAAGDPEGQLIGGKLIRGGLLMRGVLVR